MRVRRVVAMALLALGLSVPAFAQTQVRSLTVIPIKFQDNAASSAYDESKCEGTITLGADGMPNGCAPVPLSRYQETFARNTAEPLSLSMANWVYDATNGLVQLDVTVLPRYVQIPYPYPLGIATSGPSPGRAAACMNGSTSWGTAARAAASAAGFSWSGSTLIEIPQSWGRCDHMENFAPDTAVHEIGKIGDSAAFFLVPQFVGMNRWGTQWTCRGPDGMSWVVLSSDCSTQGLHHSGLSLAAQGTGLLNLNNRLANGTIPMSEVETISTTAALPITRTIYPVEVVPPSGGIRGLRVPGFTPGGIDFEYHIATKWQGWATGGLTAHVSGQANYLLDLDVDGRVIGEGAIYMLMPGKSYIHQSGLRIRVISASNAGITVTLDQTTPPPAPTCQVSANGVPSLSALTVQEGPTCANYTVGANNYIVRNNVSTGFNAGTAYVSCGGVGYRYVVEPDRVWSWRLSANPTSAALPSGCVNTGTPPPPPPPPPPTEVCGDGIDNDGDGSIDEGCTAPLPPPTGTDLTEGGTASSSEPSSPGGEGIDKAFDNLPTTKWLTWKPTGWIQYQLPSAAIVTSYALTAGAEPGYGDRDPRNWRLEGSQDGASWTTLDTQSGQIFATTRTRKTFALSNTAAFSRYRLTITANNGAPTMQLWELELYGAGGAPPPPAPPQEWSAVTGTIEQHATREEWRLTLPTGSVVVVPKQ